MILPGCDDWNFGKPSGETRPPWDRGGGIYPLGYEDGNLKDLKEYSDQSVLEDDLFDSNESPIRLGIQENGSCTLFSQSPHRQGENGESKGLEFQKMKDSSNFLKSLGGNKEMNGDEEKKIVRTVEDKEVEYTKVEGKKEEDLKLEEELDETKFSLSFMDARDIDRKDKNESFSSSIPLQPSPSLSSSSSSLHHLPISTSMLAQSRSLSPSPPRSRPPPPSPTTLPFFF